MSLRTMSAAATAGKLKLTYLPVRARAENIRMMFRYAGIDHEDEIVAGPAWQAIKADQPFDKLPALTLADGTVIAQSAAISRLVAQYAGLLPSDPVAAARQDMIFEGCQELCGAEFNINPICNVFETSSSNFAEKKRDFMGNWPNASANLAKQLGRAPFFGGDSPLYADFLAFHIFDNTLQLEPTALDAQPTLTAFVARMRALPAIAEYLSERPQKGIGAGAGGVGFPGSIMATP